MVEVPGRTLSSAAHRGLVWLNSGVRRAVPRARNPPSRALPEARHAPVPEDLSSRSLVMA